jgi:hypothetical protein
MVLRVEDGIICSNNKAATAEVLSLLSAHFEIRSLPTDRFVGLELTRKRGEKKIWINQRGFIDKILYRFNV